VAFTAWRQFDTTARLVVSALGLLPHHSAQAVLDQGPVLRTGRQNMPCLLPGYPISGDNRLTVRVEGSFLSKCFSNEVWFSSEQLKNLSSSREC
jgi:hypothetical protein